MHIHFNRIPKLTSYCLQLKFGVRTSKYSIMESIQSFEDLCTTLDAIASLQVCAGVNCQHCFFQRKTRSRSVRCPSCQKLSRLEKDKQRKKAKRASLKKYKKTKMQKTLQQKYYRTLKKVSKIENT